MIYVDRSKNFEASKYSDDDARRFVVNFHFIPFKLYFKRFNERIIIRFRIHINV